VFVIIWKYRVKPGSEEAFERAYGPGGDWVRFFQNSSGYLGTELCAPDAGSDEYATIDRWVSRGAFESFRRENHAEYERIDVMCKALTTEESKVGEFEVGS